SDFLSLECCRSLHTTVLDRTTSNYVFVRGYSGVKSVRPLSRGGVRRKPRTAAGRSDVLNREIVQHVFTKRNRHTSSGAYFVVGGEGTSIVGDKVLEWSKHDCFAVPNWAWHEQGNRSKAEAAP